jgi:pimeloyl-ACP methyl ester carboxylesterase
MADELSRSATRVIGFDDGELDFQLLRQLGAATYGGAAVGEALAAAAEIRRRGADSWTSVFAELAERQSADAKRRASAGHAVSARDGLLRASNSYRAAEYFAPAGSESRAALGHASEQAFMRSMDLGGVPYERLSIKVDEMSLPGYWFPADDPSDRVLVATSGFDGTLEETWLQIGPPAAARGWPLLLIAGPGQADTAREYPDAAFIPDTERWITPWLDVAIARSGEDAVRIALLGISFGGYFALRAAAADARIAAVIANSPVVDLHAYMTSFVGMDPEQVIPPEDDFGLADIDDLPDEEMPPTMKEMTRSLIRRFGQPSFLGTFSYLRQFRVDPSDVVAAALAMVGDGEGAEPLAQFTRFAASAGGPVTERRFTALEGADGHCQVGNLALAAAVLFDWLDETLPA